MFHFCAIFALAAYCSDSLCSLSPFPTCPPIPPCCPILSPPPPPPSLTPTPSALEQAGQHLEGVHDCVLLCSTAWYAGQTRQSGCCTMTVTHCATFYNSIQACCATPLFKPSHYAIMYTSIPAVHCKPFMWTSNHQQCQLPQKIC